MAALLFVYGTLKQGFPNHARMPGRRVGGAWRTVQRLPLWVVRLPLEDRAPWLMNQPGQGERVRGEVYAVDDDTLAAMDRFEEVGLPTGYERVALDLVADDGAAPDPEPGAPAVLRAQAYLKPVDHLVQCLAREGPFAEYTLALAAGYVLDLPATS